MAPPENYEDMQIESQSELDHNKNSSYVRYIVIRNKFRLEYNENDLNSYCDLIYPVIRFVLVYLIEDIFFSTS